jgi:hypothetical protein
VRSSAFHVQTTIFQTILHSSTNIMAAVADSMAAVSMVPDNMEAGSMDMVKTECSIRRILSVRHPRRRDSKNYAFA